ncbi:TadE/TadG family type IV pilus assembly protein [Ruegeria atlantica]|uniref:TadE/TadG family type IV pilus assembly protein n=1 Tax=Ruegeria atlantica TaxID=81569 RepID=UPI00147B3BF9|nr:TadE/TadG family type IV pilus assembly protein [Ruegeria atlantica]
MTVATSKQLILERNTPPDGSYFSMLSDSVDTSEHSKNDNTKVLCARRFAKDEDGGVFTIFVLIGFLIILGTAGIGVDIMNHERDRVQLQNTLDRAVLAAAAINQKLPPKQVVEAYLEKSGLQGKLSGEPIVVSNIASRAVTATAQTDVNTNFMKFLGIPKLVAKATSAAEESVGIVEISLILDISASMYGQSSVEGKRRIDALKEAAKTFVSVMLDGENSGDVSISVIPYATQVNAGKNILNKFTNVSTEHNYSHCVNFSPNQFQNAALDPTKPLDRTAHFDRYRRKNQWEENRFPTCPTRAGSEITPVTNDLELLHNRIDLLRTGGNTSIEIGVKWGGALLDPKFRDLVTQLTRQEIVPAKFNGRPTDYGEDDVKKVMIVMTDGENTEQPYLKPSLRSGNSGVWFNPNYTSENGEKGEYSVLVSSSPPEYYWTRQQNFSDHPYGDLEAGDAIRLTYPELFNMVSLGWNAEKNYEWQPNNTENWYTNSFDYIGPDAKDIYVKNICKALKDEGVIIFTIAFEAPARGRSLLRDCASSTGHNFEVNNTGNLGSENLSIEDAFVLIAASIRQLKLTK